jgi:EmrB/QacA subfamily drug resistance transporter
MTSSAPARIPPGKRLALAVLCAATLMTIVDETIVSVAMPSIQGDLGFSAAGLSWVVNAYLIAFGGLLLLGGRLGDLVGRHRVLLAGLGVFVLASAACAAAPSATALVVGRFVQGAGAALAASVALGMVVALFDDPRARATALGVYSFVGASGASIGLVLGGLITAAAGWRWAFLINLPIGLATVVAGLRVLDRTAGLGLRAGADPRSALLLTGGAMAAILAIVEDRARPVGIAAVLALAAFVRRQAHVERPLLPLAVFRSRVVSGANAAHALFVGAMFGFQFLIALYLQQVLGYTPAQAGLAVVPVAAGIGVMSLLAFPRIVARSGPRRALLPGLLLVAAGLALLTRAPVDGDYLTDVFPSMLLFAAGGGLTLPAVMTLAMSEVAPEAAGVASGLINTSQQVGGALGLSVLAAAAASRTDALRDGGADPATALVGGYQLAWGLGAGLVLAAAAVVALVVREGRRTCGAEAPAHEPSI